MYSCACTSVNKNIIACRFEGLCASLIFLFLDRCLTSCFSLYNLLSDVKQELCAGLLIGAGMFLTSIFVKSGNVTKNGFQDTAFKQGKKEKKILLCNPTQSSAVPIENAVVDIRSLKSCCCSALLAWQWKLTLCNNLYLLSHSVMLHNSYNDCLVTAKDQHQS